jgi:ABC-type multidrug transport system fused ATPase/permease subunit
LLWGLSTAFGLAALLTAAALLDVWLGNPSASGSPSSIVRTAIDRIRDPFTSTSQASMALLAAVTALIVGHRLCGFLATDAAATFARSIGDRLRRALLRQHTRIGPGDLDGGITGSICRRATSDVDTVVESTTDTLVRISRDTQVMVGCLVLSLLVDPQLALQCLLLPAAVLAWLVIRDRSAKRRHLQSLDDDQRSADRRTTESMTGVRLASGYGFEDLARDRFDAILAENGQRSARRNRSHSVGRTIRQGMTVATAAAILFLISRRVLPASTNPIPLDLPSAVVLLASIAGLLRALDRREQLPFTAERGGLAADRIHEYLDRVPPVSQAVGARFLQPLADELRFESVSWQAGPTDPVLNRLDLVIPAGETTALLSVDPREARAMVWMVARFIDPHGGRILIDDQDIATGTLESLRAEVLTVSGDGDCFPGTVLENICCGRSEQGLSRATEAAKAVHAHHFITKLPRGYETRVDDEATRLDVGQRYRIGLARALLRDPAFLVIEEPAEPLDDDTKSLLGDTYDRIVPGRTVMFLPTRLSTVRRADRVVVVHDGQVAETGRHEELVQSSELYRHWEYTRFNAFGRVPVPAEG